MDTSFWKTLSPNIKIESSVRQFYKQYYYKLVIYAPGCQSIRSDNVAVSISKRKEHIRAYNYSGSWYDKKLAKYLKEADIGFLSGLKDIYYEYPDVKIRCEEPTLTIYSTDELMIKSVAASIDPTYRDQIQSIIGPENDNLKAVLQNNTILVKTPPKYKYRVWFKEKQFDEDTRINVYNYLNGLGDLVRITSHTQESLQKSHNWIWGCYFYTNDKGVATFVTLMHPDLIREVSEFVCLNNK